MEKNTIRLNLNSSLPILATGFLVAILVGLLFRQGIEGMVGGWGAEEYSHGYLIPFISVFLIWNARHRLEGVSPGATWVGTVLVCFGLVVFLFGELGTIYTVIQYALLIVIFGLAWTLCGKQGMAVLWPALLYLVFMIPLPEFLYFNLSNKLQLISSELGVAVIRLFDISVFLDGNIIDLGEYKLQVVEACSGLRYLFPLMSFGYLCAYLYRGPMWQKGFLFLSTAPITIGMNSFRIGVIGVLVEHWGIEAAEGFLHDFEGWIIFVACVSILFVELWLFSIFTRPRMPLLDRFMIFEARPSNTSASLKAPGTSQPATPPNASTNGQMKPSRAFYVSLVAILVAFVGSLFLDDRSEVEIDRREFASFPMMLGDWHGQDLAMDERFVNALGVDDYVLANFDRDWEETGVNFYVAFYNSQQKGRAVHSPQSCIPGDGWQIENFSRRQVEGTGPQLEGLPVNRVIISKGDLKQLVYYWFPQRERILTNEYMVKWYLFWDAITRNRTDGAMVRVVTPIIGPDGLDAAEQKLEQFTRSVYPELVQYLPS
ncbi:MAG: VPLPA-CTERM-specific exosortase XrtD [Pseudomonadota bacterium]